MFWIIPWARFTKNCIPTESSFGIACTSPLIKFPITGIAAAISLPAFAPTLDTRAVIIATPCCIIIGIFAAKALAKFSTKVTPFDTRSGIPLVIPSPSLCIISGPFVFAISKSLSICSPNLE